MAQNAGLLDKLGQPGHYTLFAPTNDAFEKLGSDVLERLQGDKEVLKGNPDFYSQRSVAAPQCSNDHSRPFKTLQWRLRVYINWRKLGPYLYLMINVQELKCSGSLAACLPD